MHVFFANPEPPFLVADRLSFLKKEDAMAQDSPRGDYAIKLDFRDREVRVLRQSWSDAHEELEKAHLSYERALSIAVDADPLNFRGIIALLSSGQTYAKAVARYSNAVMAWLAFVDRNR
jgi:hypothetical protein